LIWVFAGVGAWAAVWQFIRGSLFMGAALAIGGAVLSRIALSRSRGSAAAGERAA
jgi:hypothetical protein